MILEARISNKKHSIKFIYNDKNYEFLENNMKAVYIKFLQFLYNTGYSFNDILKENEVKSIIDRTGYTINHFYNFEGTGDWLQTHKNILQSKYYPKMMYKFLSDIGVDKNDIELNGFGESEDLDSDISQTTNSEESDGSEMRNFKIKRFNNFKASQSQEEVEFIDFSQNPFRQAICVLGGSGAGKSTTIENILDEEGHEFEFIIPSASTTGLLSQFSPSKSGYVPSKLGKMILNAYDNPTQLFTAVFDECHKSNVIEMINDELLQAISTKRNNGKRFISLDDDTADLYPGTEKHRGNILIPDNLGFIFISSKPDVILHNDDFFNRIDIVQLKSYEEERLTNIEQLLSKTLSNEEKKSLKSNND
jgi:hypothetical protein